MNGRKHGNARGPVRRLLLWLLPFGLALGPGPQAFAQALTPASAVTITATKQGRLTVTLTANTTQGIAAILDGAVTAFGPGPVGITTQWNVQPGQTASVRLVGYFTSPSAALSNGAGDAIPSSEIEAQMSTVAGMPWTAFTQGPIVAGTTSIGTPGATVLFWTVPITGVNKVSSRADQLALRLNTTSRSTAVGVGTYSGTLHLRAVAF